MWREGRKVAAVFAHISKITPAIPPPLPGRLFAAMIPGMMRSILFVILAALGASAQNTQLKDQVESVFPEARALYMDLHQHPELSSHETRTAGVMAEKLRGLGYELPENGG